MMDTITDVAEDVEGMHTDLANTKSAMSEELSQTHQKMAEELSETENRMGEKVTAATSAMKDTQSSMDAAVAQMNKRLDANVTASTDSKADYAAELNIINLRLDITHLYYPAKNSFQKGRLKRREIFTELLLYTLTT